MYLVYNNKRFVISEVQLYNHSKMGPKQLIILEKMIRFLLIPYAEINSRWVIELSFFFKERNMKQSLKIHLMLEWEDLSKNKAHRETIKYLINFMRPALH